MSRKYPNRYQKQATLGLIGLGIIVSPLLFRLPFQFQSFGSTAQLEADTATSKAKVANSEELERARIEQKKETADTLKRTGVLPSGSKLKVRNYYDTNNHDPKPSATGYLADELVYVYDSTGVCIGRIQNRKWLWKYYYTYACQGNPAN